MNKETINVAVRLRPMTQKESQSGEQSVVHVQGNSVHINLDDVSQVSVKSNTVSKLFNQMKRFDFENCFGPTIKNDDIYQRLMTDLISVSMRGVNGTLFMYGQTGSGKTFTVTGDLFESMRSQLQEKPVADKSPVRNRNASPFKKVASAIDKDFSDVDSHASEKFLGSSKMLKKMPSRVVGKSPITNRPKKIDHTMYLKDESKHDGLLQMGLKDIFSQVASASSKSEKFFVRCSYIEIYNENVYDLLRENAEHEFPLTVYEDTEKAEFYVKNAVEKIIDTFDSALDVLAFGEANRHFAATTLNHNSSRSHTLFRIFFEYIDPEEKVYESVCNFVDLAGSEKLSRFDNETEQSKNDRIKESKSINKSLFFLTQIINMKSVLKSESFIPYRNSPLTKILKNSIGGNAKTVILLCLHPSFCNIEQTLGTLRFGNLAKSIVNTVCKNSLTQVHENQEAIALAVKGYQERIMKLEESLRNGIPITEYQKKIDELEEQKRLLLERYKSLVNVTRKSTVKYHENPSLYRVDHCSEFISSCGIVDYFKVLPMSEFSTKHQTKILDGQFFSRGKDYTMEAFQNELVAAKQKRIVQMEHEMFNMHEKLEDQIRENSGIKNENQAMKRLLRVLLNSNESDTKLFDGDYLNAIIQSNLQFIDNAKSEIFNGSLRARDIKPIHPYRENLNTDLRVENLIVHFDRLIRPTEGDRKSSLTFDIPIIEKNKRRSCRDPNFHKKARIPISEITSYVPEEIEFESNEAAELDGRSTTLETLRHDDSSQSLVRGEKISSDFLLRD
jgi:hypothetical protein